MINLQPSQAERWMTCPASAMLLKGSSEYVASGQPMSRDLPDYTAEGTTAHELAKVKLQCLLQNQPMPHATDFEMDKATTDYAQGVFDVHASIAGYHAVTYEQPISIYEKKDIQCVGTPDATIITPTTIHVFDFKYGCGEEVRPQNNCQLYLYAVGSVVHYHELMGVQDNVNTIILHIFQPRQGLLWREHKLTRQELLDWYCTEFLPVIVQIESGQLHFKTGKGCKYCPIKYRCKTWLHEITDALMNLSNESPLLTNDDLSQIAEHLDNLSRFSQDAKKQIIESIESGQSIPDISIEYSKGSPKITNEQELVRRLREIGLTDDQIFKKQTVQTFGELRKIIGHEKLKNITDGVVQYSERKTIKKN